MNIATLTPQWLLFVITGIAAGIASGLFGIGGGIIIVPILVFIFGYTQVAASGTSLVALLLPVGAFAVWNYWRAQKITGDNVSAGLFIGLGIALGAVLGSQLAITMSQDTLRRIFAIFLMLVAVKMWI